jgi:hypothetical protein
MQAELPKAPLRAPSIMAKVVRVEDVWDDPEGMFRLLELRSPYSLIYGEAAYEKLGGADPWFRDIWVSNGQARVAGAETLLANPRLIEGTKQAFDATIVRPQSLLWNLHAPMVAGRPHFDLSPYRGVEASWPYWLHVVMHNSQLFLPWAVPSTTGLSLFYSGRHGAFEYWPDGPRSRRSAKSRRSGTWRS